MALEAERDRLSTYNIVATFEEPPAAERARGALTRAGIAERCIKVDDELDEVVVLRFDQAEEVARMVPIPPVIAPKTPAKGGIIGSIPAGLIGAVLAAIGAVVFSGMPGSEPNAGRNLLIAVLVGFGAGTVFGFVAGGALRVLRLAEEQEDVAQRRTFVGVHTEDRAQYERAREVLRAAGASDLVRVDHDGNEVSTLEA